MHQLSVAFAHSVIRLDPWKGKWRTLLTKDDLVTLLPHLGHERLARNDSTCKADLDVRVRAKRLEDVLACHAKRAQAMKNSSVSSLAFSTLRLPFDLGTPEKGSNVRLTGLWKATHTGKVGINVERVVVARQAVDCSLLQSCLFFNDGVRLALGRVIQGSGIASV